MWFANRSDASFVRPETQIELSTHVWELALLAIPMTFIIITAGIDLSVGSTMALCAVVLGLTYERGVSPWIGAGLALMTGIVAGALNGWFVAKVRVHPLIVTLATLAAYRGVAEGISLARPISGFPAGFTNTLSAPVPCVLFVGAAFVAAVVLAKTPFGRSLYAIGYNETATRFSGIAVDRIKLLLYTLSGAAAAVAAVLYVARRNTAKADIGLGIELDVITAVVLGGTSIFGGRGNIVGTLLGILLIHETREFVGWRWHKDELNFIVIGIVLILSVLLNRILTPRGRET
jgi:rhamnose transport system permease protein